MSPPGEKAVSFTARYKRFVIKTQRFPPVTQSLMCIAGIYPSLHHAVGIGSWEPVKNADTLTAAVAVSNKLSFVSDAESHIFYYHP